MGRTGLERRGIPVIRNCSLLIKPASYRCNLRCSYCFYSCKEAMFGADCHLMSPETLRQLIRNFYQIPMETYQFAWQGGEPTLMGLEFYRTAVAWQKQYLPPGCRFTNTLQTNGTLLTEEWARFLKDNRFLVGISVDGPQKLHDAYRVTRQNRGSYRLVMRGLDQLRRQRVPFNILTLVSAANCHSPQEVYQHSLDHGGTYQQYIECLEFQEGDDYLPFSLRPGQFGDFMCRIFDLWYPRHVGRVSVRLFDSILSRLLGGPNTCCSMGGDCRNHFVVEHDGGIYPCDFFVQDGLCLGNVTDTSFAEAADKDAYVSFGRNKEPHAPDCRACQFLPLCMGDCPKHRRGRPMSRLCQDWKLFYAHTIQRFERLATALEARRR